LKALGVCTLFVALILVARADDAPVVAPSDNGAFETDRPGEIENPFTLPVGSLEVVNYVVSANDPGREDIFGGDGAAVFMDTALRIGVAPRIEALVSVDSFLSESSLQGARPESGFGYTTVAAKWNFLRDAEGDYGIGVAPFVRFPINGSIGGTSRPETGFVVPFDIDLEGGWELQGSTGVARSPGDEGDWSTQWENQVSIERSLTKALVVYAELEVESSDEPTAWSTEFGVNWRVSTRVVADVGASVGIGRNRSKMSYAGFGWHF
jgi:hypothetical protein